MNKLKETSLRDLGIASGSVVLRCILYSIEITILGKLLQVDPQTATGR